MTSARTGSAPERFAVITGTGSYVPDQVLTNADLAARLGVEIEPFVSETLGIYERHVCGPDESTADLAEHAARRALDDAGLEPDAIDLLIVATDTPEFISPTTSSVLHCDAVSIVVDTVEQLDKVLEIAPTLPRLRRVICDVDSDHRDGLRRWRDYLAAGGVALAQRPDVAAEVDARTAAATLDDIALLIYTSGSTGEPKGADSTSLPRGVGGVRP